MDCKKALVEADGDVEKASEWLRVKGLASAAKKGERATKEGLIETYVHTGGKLGVMVEVNCETDFVSKGDEGGPHRDLRAHGRQAGRHGRGELRDGLRVQGRQVQGALQDAGHADRGVPGRRIRQGRGHLG